MATLIFKNETSSTISVEDLGIELAASEDLDLITNFSDEELLESTNLESAFNAGATCYLNGTTSLTYSDLIDYLTKLTKYDVIDYAYISNEDSNTDVTGAELEELTNGSDSSLHIHDNRYYTKTQLSNSNSGTVSVNWDNITNAPQFGALEWKPFVLCMLKGKGTGTAMNSSSPSEGWFWWNTDDGHIYKYVSGSWTDQGTPSNEDKIIYKDGSGSDDKIYEYNSGSWDSGTMPSDNWAVMVSDDGDGKPAQYVYNSAINDWIKIADVDWYHASGISSDPFGNLVATNVQDALEELQGDIDTIGNFSLDDVYNNGSVVYIDDTIVDWELSDSKSFKITTDSGATNLFIAYATSSSDKIEINGDFDLNGGAVSIDGTNISVNSSGNLTLKDQYITSSIPLSESGTTGLDSGFSSTSIIGAINEAYNEAISGNTLDEVYDGETGTRIINQDNGSIEWRITDSYEHNFTDNSGNNILSIRALSSGDLVRVNGNLDINGGAINLDATANSNFTVDSADLIFSTTSSGNIELSSVDGLTLKDGFLSSAIPISESGTTGLDSSFSSTSIIGAINELASGLGAANDLDEAYDGSSGSGSGRTIIADSGPVEIDAASGTNAPLELNELSSAPSSNLESGQLAVIGDQLYLYDGNRSKWLSVNEEHYVFSSNVAKGKYLKIGSAFGYGVGYRIPINATITKVNARQNGGNSSATIQIRKNGSSTPIKTFNLSSSVYTSTDDDIDLTAGDYLQAFVTGSGAPVKKMVLDLFIKWRK